MSEPDASGADANAEPDPHELDHRLRHVARLETVGQLAAGFAHELGTPLNVILGRARMITRGRVKDDAAVECAEIIVQQAMRMTDLVRALLTFARSRPSPTGRVELHRLVEQVRDLMQPMAHKKHIGLECMTTPLTVVGDTADLQQVVANVVMNAVDAMPRRGGVVRLSLVSHVGPHPETGAEGQWHGVTVIDRGPGVPPELRQRVFDPFFTTKDVGEGTGLGLSVAYGIVRDHGGWIAIEDAEPGPGAAITVWLPAAR